MRDDQTEGRRERLERVTLAVESRQRESMELTGIEPVTPGLQSRCSPS